MQRDIIDVSTEAHNARLAELMARPLLSKVKVSAKRQGRLTTRYEASMPFEDEVVHHYVISTPIESPMWRGKGGEFIFNQLTYGLRLLLAERDMPALSWPGPGLFINAPVRRLHDNPFDYP